MASSLTLGKSAAAVDNRDNLVRQLSHTATRTKDMEATRVFYEDFLGLPMITSLVADFDAVTNDTSNYIHCFFQLADGSAVAFFQFEDGYRDDVFPRTSDPYERHLALRVDTKEVVEDFQRKANERGLQNFIIDHDDFYSLYLHDPDGDQIELAWHKPSLEQLVDPEKARRVLKDWLAAAKK